MISVYLGNVGSGKTVSAVRHTINNADRIRTFANIAFKKTKAVKILKPEMIMKKTLKKQSRRKDGAMINVYDYELNLDFWKAQTEKFSVVIDEFHNIANARTSMSKPNRIFNKWLTMIRRVLGSASGDEGELIIISQLSNQIDLIARELCHQIRYHICHYKKKCSRCGSVFHENSEVPEPMFRCTRCGWNHLSKFGFRIEVWKFASMTRFQAWYDHRSRTFYGHYLINDIEKYFKYYDTYQWDNLFEDY